VAGTSLLAAPLLPRLGALAVTIYACGLAAAQLLAAAVLVRLAGGPPVLRPLTGTELAALLYLAVAVTAVVFVAWFSAVERLGAERTGLFNGLVPIASLIAVAVIGTGTVTGMQLAGALSVLAGVTLGLTQRAGPPADTRRPGSYPPPQQTRPDEPARQPAALLAERMKTMMPTGRLDAFSHGAFSIETIWLSTPGRRPAGPDRSRRARCPALPGSGYRGRGARGRWQPLCSGHTFALDLSRRAAHRMVTAQLTRPCFSR
jgi:EamA-like transporter family